MVTQIFKKKSTTISDRSRLIPQKIGGLRIHLQNIPTKFPELELYCKVTAECASERIVKIGKYLLQIDKPLTARLTGRADC